jgi:hypothetical protein
MLVRLVHVTSGRYLSLGKPDAAECLETWKGDPPGPTDPAREKWEKSSGSASLWGLRPYSGVDPDKGLIYDGAQVPSN